MRIDCVYIINSFDNSRSDEKHARLYCGVLLEERKNFFSEMSQNPSKLLIEVSKCTLVIK